MAEIFGPNGGHYRRVPLLQYMHAILVQGTNGGISVSEVVYYRAPVHPSDLHALP